MDTLKLTTMLTIKHTRTYPKGDSFVNVYSVSSNIEDGTKATKELKEYTDMQGDFLTKDGDENPLFFSRDYVKTGTLVLGNDADRYFVDTSTQNTVAMKMKVLMGDYGFTAPEALAAIKDKSADLIIG